MRVCVTRASGRAGRAVVAELLEHGHWVVATDLVLPAADDLSVPVLRADLTDYGQAVEAQYPIPPGVCWTSAVTPSLPFPPSPVGHFTAVAFPTSLLHCGLTFDR